MYFTFLLTLCFFNPLGDVHWPRWWLFQSVIILGLIFWAMKRYPKLPVLMAGYVLLQSLSSQVRFHPYYDHTKWSAFDLASLLSMTGQNFMATTALILIALGLIYTKSIGRMLSALTGLGIAHSGFWLFQAITGFYIWHDMGIAEMGFFGNTAMGGAFSALTLPLVFRAKWQLEYKAVAATICLVCVWLSQSTMAFVTAAVALTVYGTLGFGMWGLLILASAPGAAYLLGHSFDSDFFNLTQLDRWTAWQAFLHFWWTRLDVLLGAGPGTFKMLGSGIHKLYGLSEHGGWHFAHNDWLEILFEHGVIGFGLWVLTGMQAVWIAFKANQAWLVSGLLSFGALMFGLYPLQMPVFSLMALCFLLSAHYHSCQKY